MCGTWKSEPFRLRAAGACQRGHVGGRRPFRGAAGTGEGLSQAAGVGGVCRSRVKKPESQAGSKGSARRKQRGSPGGIPASLLCVGTEHSDLALRVCPYSRGGTEDGGRLGPTPRLLLDNSEGTPASAKLHATPQRRTASAFRAFLQTYQLHLRLLPTRERSGSYIIEHLIMAPPQRAGLSPGPAVLSRRPENVQHAQSLTVQSGHTPPPPPSVVE